MSRHAAAGLGVTGCIAVARDRTVEAVKARLDAKDGSGHALLLWAQSV